MEQGVIDKRREICSTCPQRVVTLGVPRCNLCGCVIWAKTLLPNTNCPKDLWGPGDYFAEAEN